MRIAFAGTPAFAVATLERLHGAGTAVELVLTQPDRPSGRGRKLAASPVKHAAQTLGLAYEQPAALTDPRVLERWPRAPDLLVVVAYGLVLPGWMLAWPRAGCVNLHASLLPRWRGAAPIQRAILAGDAETGVSLMRMEAGLDRGPVYAAAPTPIGARETAGELEARLAVLGADLVSEWLARIAAGSARPVPQDDARATRAPKIEKSAAPLDWRKAAEDLERQVRAFNPRPVAEARTRDGRRVRIWQACALEGAARAEPGTILAAGRAGIDVAAGRGALRLEIVQPPGGRPMGAGAYLAAHDLGGPAFAR